MRKLFLTALITTSLVSISTTTMAAQVDAAVNVDNKFMVVVTKDGISTPAYTAPANYHWGKAATRFSFDVNQGDAKQCHVSLINWGDGSVREGFAGVFKGNNGTVYTGGPGFSAHESASNSLGLTVPPNALTINAMVPATGPGPDNLGSTMNHPTWGSVQPFYTPGDFGGPIPTSTFSWIKPAGTGITTKKYWVYSTPCNKLVKPVVDVPGDHFQCYMLKKGDQLKPETIQIKDQFGESKAVLGHPRMLCNPSAKRHNDKFYDIKNKKRHLVCYNYAESSNVEPQDLMINNQMGPDKVVSAKRKFFCVPSLKYHLDKNGNVIDNGDKASLPRERIRDRARPMQRQRN